MPNSPVRSSASGKKGRSRPENVSNARPSWPVCPAKSLDKFIAKRKLDPYFKDFVDFARRREMEIVIVSDGLDYYIEKMLIRTGLAHLDFYANSLKLNEDKLHVRFPFYDMLDCQSCGNCKTYHMEKYKADGYFVVYVGNGFSDRCPSEYADLVFAKGRAAPLLSQERS